MISNYENLVNALNDILPAHYEMVLHSGMETPCISYMELTNIDDLTGDTRGYSRISYQVKVWSNDYEELLHYAAQIDKKVRPMGYRRVGSAELYDNNSTMMQKVLTYQALGLEEY